MSDCCDRWEKENIRLRAALAEKEKELERNKYEFEVSHRVVQAHKQAEHNAVRIGCENITAREAAEREAQGLREERNELKKELKRHEAFEDLEHEE